MLVSKKFWDRLSPTEQKILQESALQARDYQRTISRGVAQKAVGELKAKGMQVNEPSAAEHARMVALVKPIIERFSASYDPAMVRLFNEELARVRKLP